MVGTILGTNNTSLTAVEFTFAVGQYWSSGTSYYWNVKLISSSISDTFTASPSVDYGFNTSTTKMVLSAVSNLAIKISNFNTGGGNTMRVRLFVTEVVVG